MSWGRYYFFTQIPHAQPDLEMPTDASIIGKEAANLHKVTESLSVSVSLSLSLSLFPNLPSLFAVLQIHLLQEVFSKLNPKPVLKADEGKKKKKKKTVDQSEDEGVKVWVGLLTWQSGQSTLQFMRFLSFQLKMQECQIGTSVPDDELEDLRPVRIWSHN